MRADARLTMALLAGAMAIGGIVAPMRRGCQGDAGRRVRAGGELGLARRALPGFSIELPAGRVKEERLDYGTGKVSLELEPGPGGVAIEWQVGERLTDDDLEQLAVQPLREVLGLEARARRPVAVPTADGPGTVWTLARADRDLEMRLISFACGRRWFALMVSHGGATVDALTARIRDSVRCAPDAAEEARRRAIPVVATLGPEIGVAEDNDDSLILESLDGEAVVFSRTTVAYDADLGLQALVARLLEAFAASAGITGLTVGTSIRERRGEVERPIWRGAGELDGRPVRVLMTLFACGEERLAAIYAGGRGLPEARGVDALVAVACAAPGAPPPRPRPIAELAAEACARGDARGCVPADGG